MNSDPENETHAKGIRATTEADPLPLGLPKCLEAATAIAQDRAFDAEIVGAGGALRRDVQMERGAALSTNAGKSQHLLL